MSIILAGAIEKELTVWFPLARGYPTVHFGADGVAKVLDLLQSLLGLRFLNRLGGKVPSKNLLGILMISQMYSASAIVISLVTMLLSEGLPIQI